MGIFGLILKNKMAARDIYSTLNKDFCWPSRAKDIDLSTVSIKIPQIGKHPVYYNSNNQSFPPIFIGAILNYKNVAIFRDIFIDIIAFS